MLANPNLNPNPDQVHHLLLRGAAVDSSHPNPNPNPNPNAIPKPNPIHIPSPNPNPCGLLREPRAQPSERHKPSTRKRAHGAPRPCLGGGPGGLGLGLRGCWWHDQLQPGLVRARTRARGRRQVAETREVPQIEIPQIEIPQIEIPQIAISQIEIPDECDLPDWSRTYP